MYYNYEFFQELEQRLFQLEQSNQKLTQENKQLKQKVDAIKPIHIENINYKIQELVVRELKGTLNIGMSGITDPKELSKWIQEEDPQGEYGEEVHLQDMSHNQHE